MAALVTAETAGTTETEATERARIAQVAADRVLAHGQGSTASLSLANANADRLLAVCPPGARVRLVVDGTTRECTVRTGGAELRLDVERVAAREGRKTISDLITDRQRNR
jgi:hypothetical protein